MNFFQRLTIIVLVLTAAAFVQAEDSHDNPEEDKSQSPWIITPLFSSDPKVSTSAGALAGYVHKFDEKSPASMFGIMGTYSTTDSYYYGIFGRTYFSEDTHRLILAAAKGVIRNDYEDFQGSGLPLQTTDDVEFFALRYSGRVIDNWYIGPQFISTNYAITGDDQLSGEIIEEIGLTGFKSNAIGLYAQYDSTDNKNSPSSGQVFEAHNLAYRKSLGGETSFDAYTADYQFYLSHGKGHVAAAHAKGRWTHGAPPGGFSTVELRGYVRGQYLAPHMTLVEVEERFSLTEKWGLVAFTGLAYLYGDDVDDDLFPAVGTGVSYQLNDEKMVVRGEFALGKSGNYGFYIKFGHPFNK